MTAFLVLILAALSRFVPHTLHGVGLNITAVGGGLLFFGARQPRWQCVLAAGVMAITDVLLTLWVFSYPFHPSEYLLTWLWYAAACLIGSACLRRVSLLRVVAAVFASATGFFLLSNFAAWAGGALYPRTALGLANCYVAGLPFYGNDLVSTALTSAVLFGLPVVARRLGEALQSSGSPGQPVS